MTFEQAYAVEMLKRARLEGHAPAAPKKMGRPRKPTRREVVMERIMTRLLSKPNGDEYGQDFIASLGSSPKAVSKLIADMARDGLVRVNARSRPVVLFLTKKGRLALADRQRGRS